MKCSVAIITKNEVQTLPDLLSSLEKQTLLPSEVVIIDDYSHDGTWEWVVKNTRQFAFPLKNYQLHSNRSEARNEAMARATFSVVAFTDAGCIPEPEWLAELLMSYQQSLTTMAVVAGITLGSPHNDWETAQVPYVLPQLDQINESTFLPATRSMLLPKKVWDKVGKFNKKLNEGEDYAFAKQLKKHSDVSILVNKKAMVRWRPRPTLSGFIKMIFGYAQGDAMAGSFRPKVLTIYGRYTATMVCCLALPEQIRLIWLTVAATVYSAWAIKKNRRYVGKAWYFLPVLQIISDIAVMGGTLKGLTSSK